MSTKKLTKKIIRGQSKKEKLEIKAKLEEEARLQQEAYNNSVEDRLREIMSLTKEEQEEIIREFIIEDDLRKTRERELVNQLRECVVMLEQVRAMSDSDSDDEIDNLRELVMGI
jgi:hypothetical protein